MKIIEFMKSMEIMKIMKITKIMKMLKIMKITKITTSKANNNLITNIALKTNQKRSRDNLIPQVERQPLSQIA